MIDYDLSFQNGEPNAAYVENKHFSGVSHNKTSHHCYPQAGVVEARSFLLKWVRDQVEWKEGGKGEVTSLLPSYRK